MKERYYMSDLQWWVEHGDAAETLRVLPDGSVDALVTDPPAGIGFMGKEWDGSKGGRDKWIAWLAGIFTECRRTMKPGAYGWVWALPRTAHWTATACEDAGFAIRDVLVHVATDRCMVQSKSRLKPNAEHWILVKRLGVPTELRIDENRNNGRWPANIAFSHSIECDAECVPSCSVRLLDQQSGHSRSSKSDYNWEESKAQSNAVTVTKNIKSGVHFGDSGGASRFFYQAKPSTKERSQGLPEGARNTHTTVKSISLMRHLVSLIAAPGAAVLDPFTGSGSTGIAALAEGCHFVGIEREAEYVEIARQRIAAEAAKAP
jgi:site-specific DNA-methyltransferase (adenine-specific)